MMELTRLNEYLSELYQLMFNISVRIQRNYENKNYAVLYNMQ